MTEVVARAGQKVRCVEVGFGGEVCQNLTQGKEYAVISGGGDESIVFEGPSWMLKTLKSLTTMGIRSPACWTGIGELSK